jgi:carbon starvation protein CstA
LWVVIGCILGGAVHDYFSGMLSIRSGGKSVPELVGDMMGMPARQIMRIFSILLLMLVGVVFIVGPAKLLGSLTGLNVQLLLGCIFAYYFIATILPIDKLIGRLYPFFGALLVFMTVGVLGGLIFHGYELLPNLDFVTNTEPSGKPIWPLLFITISCGAISGFHATQSPLMARCINSEKNGRPVFYGSMIMEGIIALIWVTVGLSFHGNVGEYSAVLSNGGWSAFVNLVCNTLLGPVGGIIAILGVIVLPITSGDTAFRSTRLIIAEIFNVDQKAASKRLLIAVPLFVTAYLITMVDFMTIFRYFGWSNQVLSMLMLWTGAIYLAKMEKFHWICSLPATFMTAVDVTFILQSNLGFGIAGPITSVIGVGAAVAALICFVVFVKPIQGAVWQTS